MNGIETSNNDVHIEGATSGSNLWQVIHRETGGNRLGYPATLTIS
jgi:hypothetical protein